MALGPVMAMIISSAGASLPEVILLKSILEKSSPNICPFSDYNVYSFRFYFLSYLKQI